VKRVLVAVDGSEIALRAVDLAAEIAQRHGAELVIATVAEDCGIRDESLEAFAYSEHMVGPVAELLRRAAEKILAIARDRATRAGATAPHIELRSGEAVEQILELTRVREIDFLVFGHRGRSATGERQLLGGTAFKLANLAPCNIAVAQ
jgi:nucleotide-binding universal stress UspA family protein